MYVSMHIHLQPGHQSCRHNGGRPLSPPPWCPEHGRGARAHQPRNIVIQLQLPPPQRPTGASALALPRGLPRRPRAFSQYALHTCVHLCLWSHAPDRCLCCAPRAPTPPAGTRNCVCVCACVCVCVCVCVCMHACMHAWYVCMACMHARYVCMHVSVCLQSLGRPRPEAGVARFAPLLLARGSLPAVFLRVCMYVI